MNNAIKDFAFSHEGKTFIVRATDEAVATAIFANKIRGQHGFSEEATFDDIKNDIREGDIEVGVVIYL